MLFRKIPKTGFAVLFICRTRTEIYTFENKTETEGYLAINFPFWSSKNWIQSGTQTFGPQ